MENKNQNVFSDEEIKALPPVLTANQAARVLGCSYRTVARMCDNGTLRHCRVGNRYRVNRDALLAYAGIESGEVR